MQAMILAAGFGTRLLPFTEVLPKPLFPILNEPLLLLTIKRLQAAGFDKIIVNCHHLAEQIEDAISDIPGVIIQHETTVLGTGGGLRRALSTLSDEPLLITNGDIYHTVSYLNLYQHHLASSVPVTLALHDYPRFNSVPVENGNVVGFKSTSTSALAFSGLHVIDPSILMDIPENIFSCIIELYRRMLAQQRKINVFRMDDCYWTDMGTVEDYLGLHEGLLQGTIPKWPEMENGGKVRDGVLVGEKTHVPEDCGVTGWACFGKNVTIPSGVSLDGVVAWDDADLSYATEYSNTIIKSRVSV